MYTALVIFPDERDKLRNIIQKIFPVVEYGFQFQTNNGQLIPHHMTLNLGKLDFRLNDICILGKCGRMTLDAVCLEEHIGVCAFRVTKSVVFFDNSELELKSINKVPHVTACLKPGVKPVMSNKLNWDILTYLPEPIMVQGQVEEC